jgi:hypothetical protein
MCPLELQDDFFEREGWLRQSKQQPNPPRQKKYSDLMQENSQK